jgi:hypothetical protein
MTAFLNSSGIFSTDDRQSLDNKSYTYILRSLFSFNSDILSLEDNNSTGN